MGIKGLNKLIKEQAPSAIQSVPNIAHLRQKKIGIDASMSVYQWYSVGCKRNIVNNRGEYINHIQGAFFRTARMILGGLQPCYVFDGEPPAMKGAVLAARRKARAAGATPKLGHKVFQEVATLFNLMGVRTVAAPGEAEAQASAMTRNGTLDAVGSGDTDTLAFGALYMVQGLDASAKNIIVIDYSEVLSALGLTRDQFIDLCILLGCDYTCTLPRVGPARALQLVRQWGTIENIICNEKLTVPSAFDFVGARKLFTTPAVISRAIDTRCGKLNPEEIMRLRAFLVDIHGLSGPRIDGTIAALAAFYAKK